MNDLSDCDDASGKCLLGDVVNELQLEKHTSVEPSRHLRILKRKSINTMVLIATAIGLIVIGVLSSVGRANGGANSQFSVGLWGSVPPDTELDGYYEGPIMFAHDRKLCIQPTPGVAHDWHCHPTKDHNDENQCKVKAREFVKSEVRRGFEVKFFPGHHSKTPCGCNCCKRWVHGRPEPGGGLYLRLWPCDAETDGRQHFLLPESGKGHIRLKNWPDRCLTVGGPEWPLGGDHDANLILLFKCGHKGGRGQTWIFPDYGQGPIKLAGELSRCLDGGRVNKGDEFKAKLQIWHCEDRGLRYVNQLFLVAHREANAEHWHPKSRREVKCPEKLWHDRMNGQVCGQCTVPIQLSNQMHKNCYLFCHSEGRECLSAHEAGIGCNVIANATCASQLRKHPAICQCGEKFLRGNYASLSEFWIDPKAMRVRVREMEKLFGIREFAFEFAFEGFSKPPGVEKSGWKCKLQNRPVNKATVKAAIDEIRKMDGRSWFVVHASAVDRDDKSDLAGEWTMPAIDVTNKLAEQYFEAAHTRRLYSENASNVRSLGDMGLYPDAEVDATYEQTYEEMCGCEVGENAWKIHPKRDPATRLMDMVNPNPAWAIKVAPRWAKFAKAMGFSGIHWETFGAFGNWDSDDFPRNPFGEGAPEPDLPGFLRAAVPILAHHGLEQTMAFVNGYGWDHSLMLESSGWYNIHPWIDTGGRAVAFPYWEVWNQQAKQKLFEASSHNHFVMAMYPGYSRYHCCRENERQNAGDYGVWPFNLGISRLREARNEGGKYHMIVDGHRYIQGPFVADAVRMSQKEINQLSRECQAAL